jgi:uncharacterized protein (TIGR02147 family)
MSYRIWLAERLEDRRKRNPAYSLRAFARSLQLPAASLSQIMLGKRPLTFKTALRIADRMDFSPKEKRQFLNGVVTEKIPSGNGSESSKYIELEAETFAAISDWYHYAILSLGDIKPNICDAIWISKQLGISRKEASAAIQRLFKLGLIRKVGKGFEQSTKPLDIQSGTYSAALRKYHRENLHLAERALEDEPIPFRDFNSITMAVDMEKIPEAKEAIRKFRDEISNILETGNKSRVYTLAIQLFPISKNTKRRKNHA